ncbi:TPA: DEAD/DEAH box helicase family protein [Vibrio harveyi]|nr:DEAD/DEAH box helicase family protein [Vibrio harveyi]
MEYNLNFPANKKQIVDILERLCGLGKTRGTLQLLAKMKAGGDKQFTVIASPTLVLSEQSYNNFYDELCKLMPVTEVHNHLRIIDKDHVPHVGTALDDLYTEVVKDKLFTGVVFITHDSLFNENTTLLLRDARVVIDECPTSAISMVTLPVDNKHIKQVLKYCDRVEFTYGKDNYGHTQKCEKVTLKQDTATTFEVATIIRNYDEGHNRLVSEEYIDLMRFLQCDYSITYYTTGTTHLFQAINSKGIRNVLHNSKYLTVLGANIRDSLFGILAEERYGYTLNQITDFNGVKADAKHEHSVKVIQYLADGHNISNSLKDQRVCDALVGRTEEHTVRDDMYIQAVKELGSDFVFCVNNEDGKKLSRPVAKQYNEYKEKLRDEKKYIHEISTHVHGRNDFNHLHKVAIVAVANLSNEEISLLKAAAFDLGVSADRLIYCALVDRYLDPAYQVALRCSLRNAYDPMTSVECVLFVGDSRVTEYLHPRFSGSFEVADRHKYKRVSDEAKDFEKETRYKTVCTVLLEAQLQAGKPRTNRLTMPQILENTGISKRTFDRMKVEFADDLIARGLWKPNRKRQLPKDKK